MAFGNGHDMADKFNFGDGLGRTYTGLAFAWSTMLIVGVIFLIVNHNLPFLRIRNIPLTISAVATLHIYWLLCMFAYGLNGFFPCAVEYWIMNIYLPLGIALFHASNTQLLHVADIQRRYMSSESVLQDSRALLDAKPNSRESSEGSKLHRACKRTILYIAIGILVQFIFALVIFLVSKKFHYGWGLVGFAKSDDPTMKRECRKGWEWILSIVWQIFWSWMYAPYLLWKVRRIHDVHGWRKQTIICCAAGLPASPMWLLALYVPQMSGVSRYFIPPLWFVPSILLIEACMIFVPCWHILQHFRQKKETLRMIEEWEKGSTGTSIDSASSGNRCSVRWSHGQSIGRATISRQSHCHMYTSTALEKALQTNPIPLLEFAALKDFSGENISFLNHVQEWKKDWHPPRSPMFRVLPQAHVDTAQLCHHQFVKALSIYSSFVSVQHSNFPINISHSHLKELESIFGESAASINIEPAGVANAATPFDDLSMTRSNPESSLGKDELSLIASAIEHSSVDENSNKPGSKTATVVNVFKVKEVDLELLKTLSVPSGFSPEVFDNAVESVKYMVLTNTWPKFVDHGYASIIDRGTVIDRFHERLGGCGIRRSRVSSF